MVCVVFFTFPFFGFSPSFFSLYFFLMIFLNKLDKKKELTLFQSIFYFITISIFFENSNN
ncbi:hypothetical protein ASJ82_01030 [Methanosphaera cuniculi]|uniref:Uncharacterized protein n=1 Tax=Methanosphaera cuniculi TaxID=1077256 RepID=A0A2A2HFA6_9EURY|nr:hypothetical protein ASJ82_01030 [Methanosphaera cuniculi]